MTRKRIFALGFLACGALMCCAPLAHADNAAQKRARKAAEYRDTKEPVEQPWQRDTVPAAEGSLPDAPRDRQSRTPVDGMKTFYEPEAVTKDGDAVYFRMYSSPDPAAREEGVEYSINCKTEEITSKAGAWKPPMRVLPGEQMYPIAKTLCEWGSGFGAGIKKLFD